MDFLLEFIGELLIEGSLSSKIPRPVRLFFITIIFIFYIALSCLFAVISFTAPNTWLKVFFGALFLFIIYFLFGLIKKIKKPEL